MKRKWFWKQNNSQIKFTAFFGLITILTASLLSACGGQAARSAPDYYIPPSLVPKSSPIQLATPTQPLPTPTPDCDNDLTFVTDATVPDGTAFPPDAPIDKKWLVENSGTCNWDQRYRVRFLDGDLMGAPPELALYPALSGSEVEIQIVFTAPAVEGTYTSRWQAFDPNGDAFGHWFSITIVVDPNLAPTASPDDEGEGNTRPDVGGNDG